MSDRLDRLRQMYSRDDQESKRRIGKLIYDKPGHWVAKTELVDALGIDESGVSRHLDDLHEDGFLKTKYQDGQLFVQWNGPGAGGFKYRLRLALPPQLWRAGLEIRPLFTINSLGGAYVPTLMFAFLMLIGFLAGLFTVVVSYLPTNSVFGVTVVEAIGFTGGATVFASVTLVLIPVAILLDKGLWKLWHWIAALTADD